MNVEQLGTILSVWAHPDDETFLAAGLMAAARTAGQRVVCVSLSAGEAGSDDPAWGPERLGRLRRWEAAAAMAVLGVDEHRVLDLPDGGFDDVGDERGSAIVAELIAEVRPDTIVTFGADGITFHPDHRAVARWVGLAVERAPVRPRVLRATISQEHLAEFAELYDEWGIWMTDERPDGTPAEQLALDLSLSGAALDRKVAALEAMASQTRDAIAGVGRDLFISDVRRESFVED